MLYTDNIGLKKPAYSDPADIADINENSDIIDREFGNRYLKSETYSVEQANNAIAQAIEALPNGLVYRGAVNYYKDLPTANNELGDTYSVKYQGETGTTADGNEYAWGEYDGTLQWIKLGVNAYTKDEIDEQHETIKSDILSAENGIAINRTTLGTQCKNLFNKDGNINQRFNGSPPPDNSYKNLVSDNLISFRTPLTQSQLAGQFIKNVKGKKITISGNFLGVESTNTGDRCLFRVYPKNKETPLSDSEKTFYNKDIGEFSFTVDCGEYDEVLVSAGVYYAVGGIAKIENLMVRYADITDNTYEEYKPSLQEQINALIAEIAELKANQTQT